MPSYIRPVTGLLVEKAAAAALSAPSAATDGVAITSWLSQTTVGYTNAVLAIDSDNTTSLTSPVLYGYGPFGPLGVSQWFVLGSLNNGSAISLTASVGYAQIVQFPNVFTRLAVGATVSAGNVGYTATPIMLTEQ